jgi:hypothetical protein
MRLTILPSDKSVYVDGLAYHPINWEGTPAEVHALQWFDTHGWIEYTDNRPNTTIQVLPVWADNAYAAWVEANKPPPAPLPPPPPTAEQNRDRAMGLLFETDWAVLPDVSDPTKSSPYLANATAFNAYRNAVRQIAITPVAGDIEWPVRPMEDWQIVS